MKVSNMKTIVALLVVLLMCVSLLSACQSGNNQAAGGGGSTTTKDTTITIWVKKALTDIVNDMIQERCLQFGVDKDITVKVEIIAYEDFYTKWAAAIESGNLPDVTYVDDAAVGEFVGGGLLEDISDIYSAIDAKSSFYDSLDTSMAFDGKHYGIPAWTSSQVMYYRKDILADKGLSVPTTWDEYRDVAIATTDTANGIYGAGIGFGSANSDQEQLIRTMMWSFGAKEFENGKASVNSPEGIACAKYVRQLFVEDKVTPPSSINWDDAGNNKAFLSGQAVTIFNTGSVLNAMKTDDPELYEKTGIAPVPTGPAGSFALGIIDGFSIFKDAKNKDLGKELIEYLLDIDWYGSWVVNAAPLQVPVFPELAKHEVWQEERNIAFLDNAQNYFYFGYPDPFTTAAGEVANLHLYDTAFQDILVSGVDPEIALANLDTEMQKIHDAQ